MDKRIEKLQEWGCDIDGALERMLDDEEFYLESMDYVINDDNFEKLGDALKEENLSAAFEAAHTLKGVLGNMGLTPMFDKVVEIVEPLRAGENPGLMVHYEELLDQKAKLLSILGE